MMYAPDSRKSNIAHRWARAAFNLGYVGDLSHDPDVIALRQAVREFWAPLDYTGDQDEIIRVAILLAVQEIAASEDGGGAAADDGRVE